MHLRRTCILLVLDEMSYKYLLSSSGLMHHSGPVSLLIFCLDDLFIAVSGVLNSPTIIVLLSIVLLRLLVVAFYIVVNLC